MDKQKAAAATMERAVATIAEEPRVLPRRAGSQILRVSPAVILLIAVLAALVLPPVYLLIKTSFYTTAADGSFGVFTLEYYEALFSSQTLMGDLLNSLKFAAGSALFALLLGAGQAWIVERTDTPLRQYVFLISIISLGLPHVLYTSAWLLTLGKSGPFNGFLMWASGANSAVFDVYTMTGMIIIEGMIWTPLAFLLLSSTFRNFDSSFEEAALMSGAGMAATFRRITLPLALPAVLALLLLVFIRAFEAFDIPALVGGAGDVTVLTTEVYNSIRKELPANYGQAGAFSTVLMLAVILLLVVQKSLLSHADKFQTITGKGFRPRVISLGRWRYLTSSLLVLLFIVLLVVPLGMIIIVSLAPYYDGVNMALFQRASLANYAIIADSPTLRQAVLNTIILGAASATFVCAITAGGAWLAARKAKGAWIIDQLATVPLIFPAIVLSVAFLQLFLNAPIFLYGTLTSLVIAATMQYLPYGMRFNFAGALQIHRELEEAASAAGASRTTIFLRIVLPLLLPTIITSWLFVLLLSVRAVALPILLAGPNSQVVAVVLFDLWGNGQVSEMAAFGVVWSIFMMCIGGVLYYLSRRNGVSVH
jgi:iron(III) transport system permease protein